MLRAGQHLLLQNKNMLGMYREHCIRINELNSAVIDGL